MRRSLSILLSLIVVCFAVVGYAQDEKDHDPDNLEPAWSELPASKRYETSKTWSINDEIVEVAYLIDDYRKYKMEALDRNVDRKGHESARKFYDGQIQDLEHWLMLLKMTKEGDRDAAIKLVSYQTVCTRSLKTSPKLMGLTSWKVFTKFQQHCTKRREMLSTYIAAPKVTDDAR